MSKDDQNIDWSVTAWEGSRRAQVRHALTLTLRERLEAMEGLADVARRFEEMREQGKFRRVLPTTEARRVEATGPDGNSPSDLTNREKPGGIEGAPKAVPET